MWSGPPEEQRDIETSENVRFISVETTEDTNEYRHYFSTVRCSYFSYALADQGTGCL